MVDIYTAAVTKRGIVPYNTAVEHHRAVADENTAAETVCVCRVVTNDAAVHFKVGVIDIDSAAVRIGNVVDDITAVEYYPRPAYNTDCAARAYVAATGYRSDSFGRAIFYMQCCRIDVQYRAACYLGSKASVESVSV